MSLDQNDQTSIKSDSDLASGSGHNANDLSFLAYIIGASVLMGSILISATLFYSLKQFSGSPVVDSSSNSAPAAAQQPQGTQQPAAAPSAAAPTGPVVVALKSNVPFLGSANAKVTVVEYADYQCPYCEQFYSKTWPELKAKYVDNGKIKFLYQDFAFLGPDSNTAAEASHCAADQNKFWQYHDYLFSNQGAEGSSWAIASHQKEFAQAIGLNTVKFGQCLDSGKYKQEVLDETAQGKTYGVTATPSVFINGTLILGAQPLANFEQAIDAALSK